MTLQTLIPIIIAVVAVVVIVIVFVVRRRPKRERVNKGGTPVVSTAKAGRVAAGFAKSSGFRCISPASIRGKNGTAQLEAVVVGPFGVLGVKALGYYGNVYGSKKEKEWVNVTTLGTRTLFPNPIAEAAADVRILRDALAEKNIKVVPVEVICVFTASEVQLGLPRDTGHFTMKSYKAYLDKEKFLEEKNFNVDAAFEALQDAQEP